MAVSSWQVCLSDGSLVEDKFTTGGCQNSNRDVALQIFPLKQQPGCRSVNISSETTTKMSFYKYFLWNNNLYIVPWRSALYILIFLSRVPFLKWSARHHSFSTFPEQAKANRKQNNGILARIFWSSLPKEIRGSISRPLLQGSHLSALEVLLFVTMAAVKHRTFPGVGKVVAYRDQQISRQKNAEQTACSLQSGKAVEGIWTEVNDFCISVPRK